ncbi:hypothetical protein A3K63_03230 [Candidatus Micrarchaeota archaeon RBG_16_49_10]|nr:MAG: hypothetical protein A3K63_03230 [Candidatus Micrarchaeota archaeon RBG_16_49_10]
MRPLRNFEEFIKEGIVKKQRADPSRAASLIEEAEKRKAFLKKIHDKIGVNNENANYFVEAAYDVFMELIRAKLFMSGFNISGLSAHEAEISYLRKLDFSESEVRFANDLRYFRNGIKYYGKGLDAEFANKALDFLDVTYPKLKKILKINPKKIE